LLEKIYIRLAAGRAQARGSQYRWQMQTHEPVTSFRKVTIGSNRKFGFASSILFAILGLWPLLHKAGSPRWVLISLSLAVMVVSLRRPLWLMPLNRTWFKLGLALNRIVNPVVMAILFFGAVVPLGWYLRRRGEDLLRVKMEPQATTYWIAREPPSPAPNSMKRQF